MSSELSSDITFFNGIVNRTNLLSAEKNELSSAKKLSEKPKRTSRNSLSPNPKGRVTRRTYSLQKENSVSGKTEVKSAGRSSRKNEREPLKILSTQVKTVKKNSVSPTVKKNPATRKSTAKAPSSTPQGKKAPTEKKNVPKIIVYEDATVKAKAKNKYCETKLSKSWDGSSTTGRRSRQDTRASPKLSISDTKKARHSLNDLSSIKSPNKKVKLKNFAERKKSPTSSNRRSSKFKPGQPDFEEMFSKLEALFPNVDPEFMKSQFIKLKCSLSETIEFMIMKEKTEELPSRDEYLRRLEVEKLQKKFMDNFTVENFVKMIPDPWEHFLKTEKHNCINYIGHSLHYLKVKYKKHYLQAIQEALTKNEGSLYMANKELKRKSRLLKMRATNRSKYECNAGKPTFFDIQFIHEVAFIENESKIKSYIKRAETAKYKKFKEAEKAGTLLECQSCNDFSLLQDDAVNCPANHVFCKDCVVKYVEIEMGKDNFQFKCLLKCDEKFSIDSLQNVLSPSSMARIIRRNQIEEIKAAGIEDLVCCPFCYYVAIMPSDRTVFKCLNPSCMMETCRHCKQLNHIPLKCHELEKFDTSVLEVEAEIEKQEAKEEIQKEEIQKEEKDSPVTCIHCNGEFFKKDDTNLMVCHCGATMCCVCRQPFPECQHIGTESYNKSFHDISISSNETDFPEFDKNAPENGFERSSGGSKNLLEFLSSESDTF